MNRRARTTRVGIGELRERQACLHIEVLLFVKEWQRDRQKSTDNNSFN